MACGLDVFETEMNYLLFMSQVIQSTEHVAEEIHTIYQYLYKMRILNLQVSAYVTRLNKREVTLCQLALFLDIEQNSSQSIKERE